MSTAWVSPRPDALPPALRSLGCVLWRAEPRGEGKPTKVPYRIDDPSRRASSTDPATWGTVEDATEAYAMLAERQRGSLAGIGVVLTQAAGVTCIDLDRVIDSEGHLDSRAETIVERCDSWTERSPSGTGLHVFVLGRVPQAVKGTQIEIYSDARYICITGHQWPGTPNTLRPQQAYLDHLVTAARGGECSRRPWTGSSPPPPDDLAGALLAKLQAWGVPVARLKPWSDGFLVELTTCPWADEHTTGTGGAAVMIRASGAFDFMCQHAHCAARDWRDFRAAMAEKS